MADTAYRVMFDDPMPEPSKRKNSASNQPDAPVNLHSRPHRKQQRSRVKTLKEEKQHDEEVEENVVPADTEQGNSVSLDSSDCEEFQDGGYESSGSQYSIATNMGWYEAQVENKVRDLQKKVSTEEIVHELARQMLASNVSATKRRTRETIAAMKAEHAEDIKQLKAEHNVEMTTIAKKSVEQGAAREQQLITLIKLTGSLKEAISSGTGREPAGDDTNELSKIVNKMVRAAELSQGVKRKHKMILTDDEADTPNATKPLSTSKLLKPDIHDTSAHIDKSTTYNAVEGQVTRAPQTSATGYANVAGGSRPPRPQADAREVKPQNYLQASSQAKANAAVKPTAGKKRKALPAEPAKLNVVPSSKPVAAKPPPTSSLPLVKQATQLKARHKPKATLLPRVRATTGKTNLNKQRAVTAPGESYSDEENRTTGAAPPRFPKAGERPIVQYDGFKNLFKSLGA